MTAAKSAIQNVIRPGAAHAWAWMIPDGIMRMPEVRQDLSASFEATFDASLDAAVDKTLNTPVACATSVPDMAL